MVTTMKMMAATSVRLADKREAQWLSQVMGQATEWLESKNECFSKLCGEKVTNWEVVTAHAVLLFPLLTLVGIGGAV